MKTVRTKRATDLFKPLKKGDQLCAVYLYADGHASANFERRIRDTGTTVEYYKQVDSLGVACRFPGRIVFSRHGGTSWLRAMLAGGLSAIDVRAPSLDNGTDLTKERGITVAYMCASTPFGDVYVYQFPGLLSGDYTHQPDIVETFKPDLDSYGYRNPIAETLITRTPTDVQS